MLSVSSRRAVRCPVWRPQRTGQHPRAAPCDLGGGQRRAGQLEPERADRGAECDPLQRHQAAQGGAVGPALRRHARLQAAAALLRAGIPEGRADAG